MNEIDPAEFVSLVKPALEAQDWDRLCGTIKNHWTCHEVATLLTSDNVDARKIAALAVGLVGHADALHELSLILHDPDRMVVEMAEHAMWQIWFRGGSDAANEQLAHGAEALNRHDIDHAISHLEAALELSPGFVEAFNQRAIAYYLAERYDDSIVDCRRVIDLMPLHFGAFAGLGHCHLAQGDVAEAISAYEKALRINPHLECIVELVQELRGQGSSGHCV